MTRWVPLPVHASTVQRSSERFDARAVDEHVDLVQHFPDGRLSVGPDA
jgi:hypothetical protein